MREIKFRAWQDNRMLVQEAGGVYATKEFLSRLYEDGALMQFTGLKDKNGRDIYEGDRVRHPDDGEFCVQWYHDRWEVFHRQNDACFDARNLYSVANIITVIGNIHEVQGDGKRTES